MTSIALARKSAATLVAAPLAPSAAIKGAGAVLRKAAFDGVASLAYNEGEAHASVIMQLRLAIGDRPGPKAKPETISNFNAAVDAIRSEYVTGRVAQKLKDNAVAVKDQIIAARRIVCELAQPLKDGAKDTKLRDGKVGRRTIVEHKAVRAAESAWSLMKADLGLSDAITSTEKAKKAKGADDKRANGSKVATPTHDELASGGETFDAKSAAERVEQLVTSLMQFCKKHGDVVPADYGTLANKFYSEAMALQKARLAAL